MTKKGKGGKKAKEGKPDDASAQAGSSSQHQEQQQAQQQPTQRQQGHQQPGQQHPQPHQQPGQQHPQPQQPGQRHPQPQQPGQRHPQPQQRQPQPRQHPPYQQQQPRPSSQPFLQQQQYQPRQPHPQQEQYQPRQPHPQQEQYQPRQQVPRQQPPQQQQWLRQQPPQQQQWPRQQPPQQQQQPRQQPPQQQQQPRQQPPQQQQWPRQQPPQQQQWPRQQPPQQQQWPRQQPPQQQQWPRQQPPQQQQQQQQQQQVQQEMKGKTGEQKSAQSITKHEQKMDDKQQSYKQEPDVSQQMKPKDVQESGGSKQASIAGVAKDPTKSSLSEKVAGKSSTKVTPIKSTIPSKVAEQLRHTIPVRKDPYKAGTAGRKIEVETNMLSLIFNQNFETRAIHYDVIITPDRPKFLMRPVFEELRQKRFPERYPAYDGKKNAYSGRELPFGDYINDEVVIFDNEQQRERSFNIELKKVAIIDLSWLKTVRPGLMQMDQTAIQVIDIILRQGPASRCITVGRSLFQEPPAGTVISLSNGLDLWYGTFQSAVLGWKPYLNIDVAHKGFPTPQDVISLMKELCTFGGRDDRGRGELNPRDVQHNEYKIESYLKGLKVRYEIPGVPSSKRTHRINGLTDCPRNSTFTLANGTNCTVERYFKNEKNYTIRYPLIPCLWVGSRNKKIYVPPELCVIEKGQVVNKKMDERQTSNMIRAAATGTKIRKEKIMTAFHSMRLNESPTVKHEFRLSVEGQFERVPARVLDAPAILYEKSTRASVSKGVWNSGRFLEAVTLPDDSWTFLNLDERFTNAPTLYTFEAKLREQGQVVGMTIGKAERPFKGMAPPQRDIRELQQYFREKKENKIRLVIVIIPDRVEAYSKVKQVTELQVGLLTQCVKSKTLGRLSPATVGNILLKINSKLNGINHTFVTRPPCLREPCIILGADVTHPSPDAKDIPSIAAVAASHDPNAFKYNIELRLQPPKTEIIQDLEEIMYNQFMYFYKQTGKHPLRVIFYRDGVSEGQLTQIINFELEAIKRAFRKLSPSGNYKPPITFLVVQKRHHVRLFPTNPRNSDDRGFNVQAGTVVDTHITHPSHIDFYLVSHASIQGTARPTKYRCICNENDMSEDEIEQLTYYLCHMFARCTRSVSYPAPTYYAHLAAFRARALTHNVNIQLGNLIEEQRKKLTLRIDTTAAPMFFV